MNKTKKLQTMEDNSEIHQLFNMMCDKTDYVLSTCREIKRANKDGRSIRGIVTIKRKLSKPEVEELAMGLCHKIDIKKYAKIKDAKIMREIRLGLENFVDITPYITEGMTVGQVNQIRTGLMQNVDVSLYAFKGIPAHLMSKIRVRLIRSMNK